MSDLFPNIHVERDMTRLFICILYIRGQKNSIIEREGMHPQRIWEIMDYQAFGVSIIPSIINRLINNGVREGLITFNTSTGTIIITRRGREWCDTINCRRIPGVFD